MATVLLQEADKALEDPNFYLTDGKMTLIIAPWKMSDFEGAGIEFVATANDPMRPNVVASIGNGNGPVIAMNGHLDTVPVSDPDSWRTDPFTGVASPVVDTM